MIDLKRLSLTSVAVCAIVSAGANAQGDNYYSRDKYVAVQDRAQPEFDPEPVRLGTFMVRPSADLGVTYSDNIFVSPGAEESGVIGNAGIAATGATTWSVHQLGFDVAATRNEYFDQGDESNTDLRARLSGRLDVTRNFSLGGGVYAEDRVEPRTDITNDFSPDEPISVSVRGAELSLTYQSDRVRWTNALGVREEDYGNSRQTGTGTLIDQAYRDRTVLDGRTRLSYAVSPNFAIFSQATYEQREHDTAQDFGGVPRSRDSEGYTVSAGVDFELAALVRGDVAVGYLNETKDDSFFEDVSGLSFDGRLQWFPTEITTFTFTGARRVTDTGFFSSPTSVQTRAGVRVDHELRRNILLRGDASYRTIDFEGIDREDDAMEFGVSAIYKMSRRVHFDVFLNRLDRDVTGVDVFGDPSYGETRAGVGVRLFPY